MLRGGSFDCGFDDQEAKKRGLEDICSQGDLLNLAGIEMEQIKIIVLTHLHWDHMGGIKYFKNAKVIAPKEDVNFYNSNAIRHEFISRYLQKQDIELLNQRIKEGNVILVHDDYEIMPGIKMLWIGGHTPGTHFVAIDTAEGCYVLASDVGSLYMNIQQNIPPGIFQNLLQCIEGLNLIKHIATNDEFIIPAHDVGVMDKYTCVKTGVIQIY